MITYDPRAARRNVATGLRTIARRANVVTAPPLWLDAAKVASWGFVLAWVLL